MDNNTHELGGFATNLTGMQKPCKLFITVDKEGFLIDSIAISDVVNFDSYDSISNSARRIIGLFSNSSPDDIVLTRLFYYKKRARSTRMNPVPLLTTTDGFRAISEHPNGEVPLGVEWMKRVRTGAVRTLVNSDQIIKNENVSNTKGTDTDDIPPEKDELKNNKRDGTPDTAGLPEKKRKLDVPSNYKTYMPPKPATSTGVTAISSKVEDSTANAGEPKKQVLTTWVPPKDMVPNIEIVTPKGGPGKYQWADNVTCAVRNLPNSKANYRWANNVNCEVVMSYDGVSERHKVPQEVSEIIANFVKGDFTALKPEILKQFSSNFNFGVLDSGPQEKLNEASENYPISDKNKPIKSLNDAKLEIFRLLSLLQLSKARFKDLLSWMKTLKLEEGKQGKFYLSERNVMGGGLKVSYDTDEIAAAKLNQLHKARLKANQNKALHTVGSVTKTPANTTNVTHLTTSKPSILPKITPLTEQLARPVMLMYPAASSSVDTSNSSPVPAQSGQTLIPVTAVQASQEKDSIKSPETTQKTSTTKENKGPNILRNSRSNSQKQTQTSVQTPPPNGTQPPDETDDPVPMIMYRSVKTEADVSNDGEVHNSELDPTIGIKIKREPVDANGENEFDKNSDPAEDYHNDPGENYKNVLKADDKMLHEEDPPEEPTMFMDFVVKSEPVDDYEINQ